MSVPVPPPPAGRTQSRPWLVATGVAALLCLHYTLSLWAAADESVTADEILHVTGGYFYNQFGDYRLQPENGNLPQRLAGLPAWLLDAPAPRLKDNLYWRGSDAPVMGYQFFYETGHDHWPMLMAGRALIALFSVGTGLIIFCWARSLFGSAGGFLALTLYALDPNVLAHAALATSDSTAVFFLLAASGLFWRQLRAPSWRAGALSAAAFGLACVAKYSAVLLLPMMLLLVAWHAALLPAGTRARGWRIIGLTLAGQAAGAVFIIWACYGFRYSAFATGVPAADHFIVPWPDVLPYIGVQGRIVQFCRDARLLPEAFLYGYAWVIQSAKARASFLAGEYGIFGWVRFFPLAFLWKSTLALLVALVLGGADLWRRWQSRAAGIAGDLAAVAPLLVLFAVYAAFSVTSHLNIGHRHILPLYPVLYILVGGLALAPLPRSRLRRGVLVLLMAGQLFANARVAPHYLAFFNVLAGGPANGHRLLVDSSLDWGQDLPGLARWLRAHNSGTGAGPVFLSYFGSGEPAYYGIRASQLPFVNGFKLRHPWYQPAAGLYCVSATMLQQVYSPVRGDWTPALEKEYQELRAREPLFRHYWQDPATQKEVRATGLAEAFERNWDRFDLLRFARLSAVLRAREPDAMIGWSILIYRLSAAEVDAAINGPYSAWLAACRLPSVPD